MKAKLHLAGPDDAPKLQGLVAAFHAETGISQSDEDRAAAIAPLLEGSPHGAIYVIGPRNAPIGYLALGFGYSLEFGGLDAFVDEIYVRPAVRGRGMGSEALAALAPALREAGIMALHLEVDRDSNAKALYARQQFELRDRYCLMTRRL